jgi:hypothetical protein
MSDPRGSTSERGYGAAHQRLRAQWAPRVEAGEVDCWRCEKPIEPGSPWHLGHDDVDRSITRGPEHDACNLGSAARRRARVPRRRAPRAHPGLR